MRFMLQVRADHETEAGVMPRRDLVEAMGKFNERMMDAGIMLAGEGLQPSSKGGRVSFTAGKPTVVPGPCGAPSELIAGFWMIDVPSLDDAIGWARQAPFENGVIEIRQVFEASDFPSDILPPEEAAKEQAWREAQQRKAAPRRS